jgi:hypothetical protein
MGEIKSGKTRGMFPAAQSIIYYISVSFLHA